MGRVIDEVDVICQHKADGQIIPIKFRVMTDEGVYEEYKINGYREIEKKGCYTTSDGVCVCDRDRVFECRIIALNQYRSVRLYFSTARCTWRIAI